MFKWFTSSKKKENESNPLPSEGAIASVGSEDKLPILAAAIERINWLERRLNFMSEINASLEQIQKIEEERLQAKDEWLEKKEKRIDVLQKEIEKLKADVLKESTDKDVIKADLDKMRQEKETLKRMLSTEKINDQLQQKYIWTRDAEIRKLKTEKRVLEETLSMFPVRNEGEEGDTDVLVGKYQELIDKINKSADNYKDASILIKSLDRQQALFKNERSKMVVVLLKLEKEKNELQKAKDGLRSTYGDYEYLMRNGESIRTRALKLKCLEEDVTRQLINKENEIDVLLAKKDELASLKVQLHEKERLFEREQKWLKREEVLLRKQENQMYEYSVSVQRKLYEEIEKNEQMLFIMRSVDAISPVYEQIVKNLVSCLKNERMQYIVSAYLKGNSFYEIAQEMGVSAVRVKRSYMVALNKLKALSAK